MQLTESLYLFLPWSLLFIIFITQILNLLGLLGTLVSQMPGLRATLRPSISLCKEGGVASSRGIYPDESLR